FSQYASSSNTNDSIMPALLVFGFLALTSDVARGAAVAVSGWTKFASLILVPLWSGYPRALDTRGLLRYAMGFLVATLAVFFVLFLEPSPLHAARVFYDRTVSFQIGRSSPFSIWDWRQYHARGIPDLHVFQRVFQVVLVAAALALARWPRMRSPLRMAALTTVLLVGFEAVLTHWSYLYLPWFFPFACLALVGPLPGAAAEQAGLVVDEGEPALAAAWADARSGRPLPGLLRARPHVVLAPRAAGRLARLPRLRRRDRPSRPRAVSRLSGRLPARRAARLRHPVALRELPHRLRGPD